MGGPRGFRLLPFPRHWADPLAARTWPTNSRKYVAASSSVIHVSQGCHGAFTQEARIYNNLLLRRGEGTHMSVMGVVYIFHPSGNRCPFCWRMCLGRLGSVCEGHFVSDHIARCADCHRRIRHIQHQRFSRMIVKLQAGILPGKQSIPP